MPFFKSTHNILRRPDRDEVFHENWMDSDKLVLPPRIDWDYAREMQIEDVDIWECIYEASAGIGVYAAWLPYAEFYMITTGFDWDADLMYEDNQHYNHKKIETYYAMGAQKKVQQRMKELGIPFSLKTHFIDSDDMWIYS
jgi:hypothetical protein